MTQAVSDGHRGMFQIGFTVWQHVGFASKKPGCDASHVQLPSKLNDRYDGPLTGHFGHRLHGSHPGSGFQDLTDPYILDGKKLESPWKQLLTRQF